MARGKIQGLHTVVSAAAVAATTRGGIARSCKSSVGVGDGF
jgi:hypothetical protein